MTRAINIFRSDFVQTLEVIVSEPDFLVTMTWLQFSTLYLIMAMHMLWRPLLERAKNNSATPSEMSTDLGWKVEYF